MGTLRTLYSDYEQFQDASERYGLAKRLGFTTSENAWSVNPIIETSGRGIKNHNPSIYKLADD